jgi:hypothetical protein
MEPADDVCLDFAAEAELVALNGARPGTWRAAPSALACPGSDRSGGLRGVGVVVSERLALGAAPAKRSTGVSGVAA